MPVSVALLRSSGTPKSSSGTGCTAVVPLPTRAPAAPGCSTHRSGPCSPAPSRPSAASSLWRSRRSVRGANGQAKNHLREPHFLIFALFDKWLDRVNFSYIYGVAAISKRIQTLERIQATAEVYGGVPQIVA